LLTATGAGAGVLFKNAVVPKLKSWIRQVISEALETEQKKDLESNPAAEAAAAAKAAAMAASEVANVSRELVKSRIEGQTLMLFSFEHKR
jgi:peroxin-14